MEISYTPAEFDISVTVKKKSVIDSGPNTIDTDDATPKTMTYSLTEKRTGNGISGKTIHLLDPSLVDVKQAVTDVNGEFTLTYTFLSSGSYKLKYNGD